MTNLPNGSPWLGQAVSDLVAQASAVLTRELARGPWGMPAQGPSMATPAIHGAGDTPAQMAGQLYPVTGAEVPRSPPDIGRLRKQAHELIDALLASLGQAAGEKVPPYGAATYEDQVPLLPCAAPVEAGAEACATMKVANDENTPSDVTLYCTNFVADSGYEIPSLRVSVSPRATTIPAKGQAGFEIKIAVPQQTPAGLYSGLVQVMGCKYVKAVLSVEVL
jgi:hypothetical protein